MDFTLEEVNLIFGFDMSDRTVIIGKLLEAMPELISEGMQDLAEGVIARLEKMTDEDFDALELYPEYEDYDEAEV